MEIIKEWTLKDAGDYLNRFIWPNQSDGLHQWLASIL